MGYGKENSADCYSCCCCSWMLSLSQWHGTLLFFCHTTLMYIIPTGNCNWLYVAISVDWKAWGLAFLFINLSLIITFLCKIIHVYFCISMSNVLIFPKLNLKHWFLMLFLLGLEKSCGLLTALTLNSSPGCYYFSYTYIYVFFCFFKYRMSNEIGLRKGGLICLCN